MSDDPLVMYIIVRKSLEMSIGKTAVQVGHAVGGLDFKFFSLDKSVNNVYFDYQYEDNVAYRLEKIHSTFEDWRSSGATKITKGANEKEWAKLKEEFKNNEWMYLVVDMGKTELEPNTETVIGFWPMKKSEAPKSIQRLQLLKDK